MPSLETVIKNPFTDEHLITFMETSDRLSEITTADYFDGPEQAKEAVSKIIGTLTDVYHEME